MSTFALPHNLFDSSADDFQGHGSGAITPLFIPVANRESGEMMNDGTRTPVHYGNDIDIEKLFRNEVASLHSKLQELEKAWVPEKTTRSGSQFLAVSTASGHMGPPGLSQPRAAPAAQASPAPVKWQVSVGTVGHPFSCAAPCPSGGANCPDGAKCPLCHQCQEWQAQSYDCGPQPSAGPLSIFSALQREAKPRSAAPGLENSLGSAGHPYTCGNACKYVKRKSGCRNGLQCTECHFCHWQRAPLPKPPAPAKATLSNIIMQTGLPHQPVDVQFDWSKCSACKVEIDPSPPAETPVRPSAASFLDSEDSAVSVQQDEAEACPSVGSIGHPYTCSNACKYAPKQRGCKDGKLCVCCHLCVWRRYQPQKEAQFAPPANAHLF